MRLSVATPVPDSGEQATPTRRAVQAQTCEVDFATRDVDTPPVPRFDYDPMQLEAMLCQARVRLGPSPMSLVGLASPGLAPTKQSLNSTIGHGGAPMQGGRLRTTRAAQCPLTLLPGCSWWRAPLLWYR
jgi:hypothetical protein